jgi:hypothetical protein
VSWGDVGLYRNRRDFGATPTVPIGSWENQGEPIGDSRRVTMIASERAVSVDGNTGERRHICVCVVGRGRRRGREAVCVGCRQQIRRARQRRKAGRRRKDLRVDEDQREQG